MSILDYNHRYNLSGAYVGVYWVWLYFLHTAARMSNRTDVIVVGNYDITLTHNGISIDKLVQIFESIPDDEKE